MRNSIYKLYSREEFIKNIKFWNWKAYSLSCKDLWYLTRDRLLNHVLDVGIPEKRNLFMSENNKNIIKIKIINKKTIDLLLPSDFDVVEYIQLHNDLKHMSESDAKMHYIMHGNFENREYKNKTNKKINIIGIKKIKCSTSDILFLIKNYFIKKKFTVYVYDIKDKKIIDKINNNIETIICVNPNEIANRIDLNKLKGNGKLSAYWIWEFKSIPNYFKEYEKYFDIIYVSSSFCLNTFKKTISIPIKKIKITSFIDTYDIKLINLHKITNINLLNIINKVKGKTIFGYCFDLNNSIVRKNPINLVKAFNNLNDSSNVLILKYRPNRSKVNKTEKKIIFQLESIIKENSNIYSICDELKLLDLYKLYTYFDYYISPHCGEGFGITIYDNMILGNKIISPYYSGETEYLNRKDIIELEYEEKEIPGLKEHGIYGKMSEYKGAYISVESIEKKLNILISVHYKLGDIYEKNLIFNGNINHKGYSLSIVNKSFINNIKKYVKSITVYDNVNENKTKQNEENILMFMGWPPTYSENYKICVNYGWEESLFPKEYLERFQKLDYITVMSDYVKFTLINNGLKIPIYVTNLGYDHELDNSKIKTKIRDYKIQSNKKFKLLHVSSCIKRKGIEELLEAYFKEFNGNNDICLYIKTIPNKRNSNLSYMIKSYKNNHKNPPEIILDMNLIKREEIKSLINSCDCIINTSNSEGFGLPALEGLINYKPIIVTNYSGFLDFCNSENSFLVDYEYVKSESPFSNEYKISYYSKAKIDSIIYNIKKVMSLSSVKVNRFLEKSYNSIKHLTWNYNVKKNILAYNMNNKIKKHVNPKIGVICNISDNCGIGVYTQNLFKMDNNIRFLIPKNKNCKFTGENIIKCWYENTYTIHNLFKYMTDLDIVFIEFHPSFYSTDILEQIIFKLKKLDKIVLLEFHCINRLPKNGDFLKLCDRIILHRLLDLNYLKNKYNLSNFLLLELPIKFNENLINKNTIKLNNNIKSICAYGFCGKHKGTTNLIEAFLEMKNPNIILNIYTSYNKTKDKDYMNEIINLTHNKNNINLFTSYLPHDELILTLKENDLIVFPTLENSESASGSIRDALSACKPILISNSKIYTEFYDKDFIYKYNDYNSIQSLKSKLEEVLSYKKERHLNNCFNMLNYCKIHSFDKANHLIKNIAISLYINKNT